MLPPFPRSTELRSPETRRQLNPLPAAPLLHGRFCSINRSRLPTVPGLDNPGAHPANVGCKKHDVRRRSTPWPIPDRLSYVPRQDEYQGGGRADDKRAEQELVLLRGMDTQQREIERVRCAAYWVADVDDVHGELDVDTGDVQAGVGAVHGDV